LKKACVLFLLFVLTNTIFAQDLTSKIKIGTLLGSLTDGATGEPLAFSTLKVFSQKDSLIRALSIAEDGKFLVDGLPFGFYKIEASFIGYQSFVKAFELNAAVIDFGIIKLNSDAKMLKEVEVIAEKDQVQLGMDKRVFNVSKNLTSLGGTAENVLRNVPSLNIDESGNASLRNMATTIYINGKPTQLSLAQIPANQIESVEVISNPSARYDASTSGGIVNLVLKKNTKNGYNGVMNVGVGNNNRYDASLSLDYHQGKWNFTTLYNLNSTKNPTNGYVNRTNLLNNEEIGYFNQNTQISLNNQFHNGRFIVDYNYNPQNTVSLSLSAVGGAFNNTSIQTYEYLDAQKKVLSSGSRDTRPSNGFRNLGVEFDWKHNFSEKGRSLSFRSSFTQNNVSNAADWFTTAVNADLSNQTGYPETDKIEGRQIGNQYLGQLDYVHPINEKTKVEMGLRSYTYGRDQEYFFNQFDNEKQTFSLLQNYSQDAHILETVNAAYFLFNKKYKKDIEMEAGLRIEQSFMHGLNRFDNSTFGYDYPSKSGGNLLQSFFPSLGLIKSFNEDSQLGLSLSRKVGRPNFRHVFVGIQQNDRQNITIGNPNVQPEFVNTAELSYNQNINKISWFASAYYIYEDHTIKPFTTPSETDPSLLVTTFINTKADIQYGMDNTFKYSGKKLGATVSFNVFQWILQTQTITSQALTLRSKATLSYKLPANFSAQINVERSSKSPSLQGYRLPVSAADFALRKSLMNNRGGIVFTVNDIFNSRKYRSTFESANVYQISMNRREVRYFKLTLQLPIGKPDASFKKKDRKLEKPDVDFSI
jgi:ferric enterobactin receptor